MRHSSLCSVLMYQITTAPKHSIRRPQLWNGRAVGDYFQGGSCSSVLFSAMRESIYARTYAQVYMGTVSI